MFCTTLVYLHVRAQQNDYNFEHCISKNGILPNSLSFILYVKKDSERSVKSILMPSILMPTKHKHKRALRHQEESITLLMPKGEGLK